MATFLNPNFANDVNRYIVASEAPTNTGERWLALTTDVDGDDESTDYDGRQDLIAVWGGSSGGASSNSSAVGPFTWTAGETVRGFAICDSETDPSAGSYIIKGALNGPVTIGAAGTAQVEIGDGVVTVTPG